MRLLNFCVSGAARQLHIEYAHQGKHFCVRLGLVCVLAWVFLGSIVS